MIRSDINFAADDAHRFLPWLVGIMVGLASVLLCLGLTVNGWIVERDTSYSSSFTVNIPAGTENLAEKAAGIRDALEAQPGIARVTRVSDHELEEMLEPWLGNGAAMTDLPLPAVFEVRLAGDKPIDYQALQNHLASMAPGTEVDAHERWVTAFSNFVAATQLLIAILATLIVGGLAIMIAFTSRASLKLHAKTVHLLHSIGASDRYITRQFQREAFRLVLPGAFAGGVAGGIVYWAAGLYMASLPTSAIPSLAMGVPHLALLLLMPPACTLVAWSVARRSIMHQLQNVL